MAFPKTKTRSIEKEGRKFTAYIIEFENAVLCFLFEDAESKVGTLAVATPRTESTAGSSSILLGYRNANITRLLAEHLATRFEKLAFSSLFTHRENDTVAGQVLLKLTQSLESTNKRLNSTHGERT